jgi:hypothetical protein
VTVTGADPQRPPFQSTVTEAVTALRRLLDAIEEGEIDADGPKGRALHRRLEGAVAAWEEAAGQSDRERE